MIKAGFCMTDEKGEIQRGHSWPRVTYLMSGLARLRTEMPTSRAHARQHCAKLCSSPYAIPY